MNKKKLLYICNKLPFSCDDGGKIRSTHLLKIFTTLFDVSFVAILKEAFTNIDIPEFLPPEQVHIFKQEPGLKTNDRILRFYDKNFAAHLSQIEDQYDYVVFDGPEMCQYESIFKETKKIYSSHNVESHVEFKKIFAQSTPLKVRLLRFYNAIKLYLYEIKTVKKMDYIITCTNQEMLWFSKFIPQKNIFIIPNGVDSSIFKTSLEPCAENNLLFIGLLSYFPNIEALNYFFHKIYPILIKSHTNFTVHIIGKGAPDKLKTSSPKNVIFHDYVENIKPLIENSKIFIVPLLSGGGSRLKILTAAAMQKCIISTSKGAEGLDLSVIPNLHIADRPEDFAFLIIDNLKRQIDYNEKQYNKFFEQYSWNAIGKKAHFELNTLLGTE